MSLMVGILVTFHERVYDEPFTPYYDEYRGHVFRVTELHPEDPDGHVLVECVDDRSIVVKGYIHPEDLVTSPANNADDF